MPSSVAIVADFLLWIRRRFESSHVVNIEGVTEDYIERL